MYEPISPNKFDDKELELVKKELSLISKVIRLSANKIDKIKDKKPIK